ncbi:MAG: OmpH family outer membrane protein [Bacteroidaceae bacterium]|nr:OmpH family outer membrane protein [Bacteroidaceae bacterium]
MSKKLLWLFLFLLPLCARAQQDSLGVNGGFEGQDTFMILSKPKFGYLSYSTVIRQMPAYEQAQEKLSQLQQRYDEELARADREFNLKFAEFLDGQKTFPENILLKRQKELQDLMEKSIKFKGEMKNLLEQARKDFGKPVEEALNVIIGEVAKQLQLEYVLNTDNNTYPYINGELGVDITNLVTSRFK